MPPVVLWVIGAVGAFAAAKWIAREAKRINAELHPQGQPEPETGQGRSCGATLLASTGRNKLR